MSGFRYAQIMARMLNTPLLAHPGKTLILYDALCGRFGGAPAEMRFEMPPEVEAVMRAEDGGRPKPGASRFVGRQPKSDELGIEPFALDGSVGILSITGSLVNRGAWVGSYSGSTSYEGIRFQLDRLARDPRVKSVIIDMASPGGEATGVFETSAMVRKVAKEKPVTGVVNGLAASAGYGILAGTNRIVTTPSGFAGAIGAVMLHVDYSVAMAKEGIKPTLIFSGKHKVDGNPFESLSDDVRAELQSEVDALRDLFIASVANARRGRTSQADARGTEARLFFGKDAVSAKLADEVGTFEDVLTEMKSKGSRSSRSRSRTMDDNEDVVSKAEHDKAVRAAADTARAEAEASAAIAATAAQKRIDTIMASEKVKGKLDFAMRLATKAPGMSAEDVIEMTAASAPATAAAPAPPIDANDPTSIAAREKEEGLKKLQPDAGKGKAATEGKPSVNEAGSGWSDAVERTSKRVMKGATAKQRAQA